MLTKIMMSLLLLCYNDNMVIFWVYMFYFTKCLVILICPLISYRTVNLPAEVLNLKKLNSVKPNFLKIDKHAILISMLFG